MQGKLKGDGRGKAMVEAKLSDQAIRIEKIRSILKKTGNLEFKNVTALAEYVSQQFKLKFDEVINKSTLLRNSLYSSLLQKHLSKAETVTNELAALQEQLLLLQSKNNELQTELDSANKALSEQLSLVSTLKSQSLQDRTHGKSNDMLDDSPFRAILILLEHVDGFVIQTSGIYDEAVAGAPEMVMPYNACPGFFDWYFKHNQQGKNED